MKTRLLLIGAILLLAIPLGFLLRDVARDVFLMELMRMVRAVRLLFASMAQTSLWLGFLAVAVLLALSSLIRRRPPHEPDAGTRVERPGPIHGLVERIENSTDVDYVRRRLAFELRSLTLEVLAHQHRTTTEQMRQHLDAGTLAAPREVQAYLRGKPSPRAARPRGLLSHLKRRLSPDTQPSAPDPELVAVVQFLQSQLMRETARDRAAPSRAAGKHRA